ncbi:MAG TPA: hypothetical protein VN635_13150 [Conexibacter sp.]|nr:hypothetical protein [Conexibacter sp.]
MTALASLLAVVLIGLVVAWLLGSAVLRIGGVLLILAGVVGLATGTAPLVAVVTLLLGALAWLAGHWIYAYRHHAYRGPLARRVFLRVLPPRADPTRGWGVPVVPADSDRRAG